MPIFSFLLAVSVVLLFIGGELTIRGAANIAYIFRIPPVIIGLTILSFGTSLPELFVSIGAATHGKHDLLVGNVVGSNIANTLLVLGLIAIVSAPYITSSITKVSIWIALFATALFVLFFLDGKLLRYEAVLLVLAGCGFVGFNFFAHSQNNSTSIGSPSHNAVISVLLLLGGLISLPFAAELLVYSASGIARIFRIDEGLIGLTVVALGTSLPELITSLVAIFRRHGDLSVGNVIGSNIFNIFFVAGISATIVPLTINFDSLLLHITVMAIVMTIPLGFILLQKPIFKPFGWLMFFLYFSYIAFIGQSVL